MKTVVDPSNHDAVLTEWRGADAQIWLFHVSHKRMAIRLARKGEPEVLYIVAVACESISGPFSWRPADVRIVTEGDESGPVLRRVVDTRARFELVCSDVAMARGPTGEIDETFENFLGDNQ